MADPYKLKIIIRYCLPWGNFSTQVIHADLDTDVSDLRLDIEKKFSIKSRKQVLKYKRDSLTLKLLPGWPLSHFGITDKAIVYLENLESQTEEEGSELYNRDATKGGYFAKLGILNKIEEEEEDEERQSHRSSALMSFSPSFPNTNILSEESGSSDEEVTGPPQKRKVSYFMQKQVSPGKGREDIEGLIRETKASHLENIQEMFNSLQAAQKEQEKDRGGEKKKSPKEMIDHRGEQGWNSLHWAIYMGNSEIVNEFLKYKPDVNMTTSDGWTPLQLAVYKNQGTIVKSLLKEEKVKVNQETGKTTALHIAAKNGKAQLVMTLLENGADPGVKCNEATAYDVASNEKVKKILQDADNSRARKMIVVVEAEPAPQAKPPIVKGMIFKKSEHIMKMNRRYIVLNPYEGTLIQYIKQEDYPNKPRRVIPLKSLKEVRRKKAGLFDKNLHFIQLTYKKTLVFGCYQEAIANKWVEHINKAITYSKNAEDLIQNEISMYVEDKVSNMKNDFGEPTEEIELDDVKEQAKSIGSRKSSNNEENSHNNSKDGSPDSGSSSDKEAAEEAKETTEQFNQLIVDEKINFGSFEIMKELGAGAFGKVFKVRKKDNKKIFALKALRKRPLIVQRQLKYALTEANVLKRANNPFVLGLHYAFQTREYMYFVLDYCPGGDLSLHLIDRGTFTEDETRFFIAELILAIEYLHSIDVIYRDLKPENILIARDGHIKLADFGLSKEGVADKDLAKSFCGSPAYLSPEMLKNKGVGKAADIYGIGTVMYEMLIGESPYYSDDIPELYSKINKAKLDIPKTLSTEARNLLTKLLHKNPSHRIGVKDKAELKSDPFFKGINWTKLARKEIEPPKLNILEDDEVDLTVDPRSIFNDMDYNENEIKTNRVKNFTFIKKNYF